MRLLRINWTAPEACIHFSFHLPPHTITDGTIPMCARNTLELRWPTNWHGQVLEKLWHSKFWERFQFSSPSSVCIDKACIGQSVGIWVSILILRRSVDNRELRQVGENNFRVKKFLIGGIWTTRPSTVLGFRLTTEGQNLQPSISKYWNVAKFGANLNVLWSQFFPSVPFLTDTSESPRQIKV